MTEENLAAHRANGSQSQGAVTPEGKARVATVNLRHGFYSQTPNGALTALGEDPQEYAQLMNSLENNLAEGLESELVQRIGRALWRMKRAERMQDGLALKRIEGAKQMQDFTVRCQFVQNYENLERYENLADALARRDGPTRAEINTFVEGFGKDPDAEMQEFFVLLRSLEKQEEEEEGSATESAGSVPEKPEAEEREWKAARRKARAQLNEMKENYRRSCVQSKEQLENMQSAENLAALVAPQDQNALLMQRMEDSNLRQLWRLTNVLFKLRNGALAQRDVKNEGTSGDVYENKGTNDTMPDNQDDFLTETSQIER
jgi:hypothetical protein